jgi:hypothetical protein
LGAASSCESIHKNSALTGLQQPVFVSFEPERADFSMSLSPRQTDVSIDQVFLPANLVANAPQKRYTISTFPRSGDLDADRFMSG